MAHLLAIRHHFDVPVRTTPRPRRPAAVVAGVAVLMVVVAVVTIGLGLMRVLLLGARTDGSVTWE